MRFGVYICVMFLGVGLAVPREARAMLVAPSAVEVEVDFTAEFSVTAEPQAAASTLVLEHAKYLFGLLQNPEISAAFQLNKKIGGIGAPRWPPGLRILSDVWNSGRREIKYEMRGRWLLHKQAAVALLNSRDWTITLPYDLDHFYARKCTDDQYHGKDEFWYFYDPLREGCENLRRAPLAREVTVHFAAAPEVPAGLKAEFGELRGDNGNGDLFEITAINGFDSSDTRKKDQGRVNYKKMNAWFRTLGFRDIVVEKSRKRVIHRFEKTVREKSGREILVRVNRLLMDTDLDEGDDADFARDLERAIRSSDVVVYEGHSGLGVNLDLATVEKRAGTPLEFDRDKRQVFFFDSCSSYSYYLGMFAHKKTAGRLAVISDGLESEFAMEIPVTQSLYSLLIDPDTDDVTWTEVMGRMEAPLKKASYLIGVDVNYDDDRLPAPGAPLIW